mgnify:CR=1 FL=1
MLNALADLAATHPIAVARGRLDQRVAEALMAGLGPPDVAFFDLADDYARVVTAAALEHARCAGPPAGTLLAELDDTQHRAWLVNTLSPESSRDGESVPLRELAVSHTLREHAAQRLFGALPVELAR